MNRIFFQMLVVTHLIDNLFSQSAYLLQYSQGTVSGTYNMLFDSNQHRFILFL
jgi:hypothetical protein